MSRLLVLLLGGVALMPMGHSKHVDFGGAVYRIDSRTELPPLRVSAAAPVTPSLDTVLDDRDLEKNLETLLAAIESNDRTAFNTVYQLLRTARDQSGLANVMISHLNTTSEGMQVDLMTSIGWLPAELRVGAIVPLVQIVRDKSIRDYNRESAMWCLGKIGPPAWPAVDALMECLKDDSPRLRCQACVTLWQIEHRVETFFPTLDDALKRQWKPGDWSAGAYKREAVEAVTEIGSALKTTQAGSSLLALMYDFDSDIRVEVYQLVPEFASTKEFAAQILTAALLTEADSQDRYLKLIEDGQVSLEQRAFAARHGPHPWLVAQRVLSSLGETAVPELVKLLPLKDHKTARTSALWALKCMGKAGAKAADEVRKLTTDPDESIRRIAEVTLKAITAE